MKHLVHFGHGLVHDFSLMGKDQRRDAESKKQDIRMVRIKNKSENILQPLLS
jgi:hypothetical protein